MLIDTLTRIKISKDINHFFFYRRLYLTSNNLNSYKQVVNGIQTNNVTILMKNKSHVVEIKSLENIDK